MVEIHQSMWKIEPNVNPFFTTDNNSGQSDPNVSFLLRQVTQKDLNTQERHNYEKAKVLGQLGKLV